MSPRDKALAELLELMAAYVVAPGYATYADHELSADEQQHRAIRIKVLLAATAADIREWSPTPRSGAGSLASMLTARLGQLQGYAAEPLRYEPYEATAAHT